MNLGKWLNIDDFHDKEIIEIKITTKNDTILSIYDESEDSTVKVTFMGTLRMRFNDLLERNIILDVEVYESNEMDKLNDELLYLLNLDISNLHHQNIFKRYKEKIINEKLLLVCFESSYGLAGYILCQGIKIVGK